MVLLVSTFVLASLLGFFLFNMSLSTTSDCFPLNGLISLSLIISVDIIYTV